MPEKLSFILVVSRILSGVRFLIERLDIRKRNRRVKREYRDVSRSVRRGDVENINDKLRGRQ